MRHTTRGRPSARTAKRASSGSASRTIINPSPPRDRRGELPRPLHATTRRAAREDEASTHRPGDTHHEDTGHGAPRDLDARLTRPPKGAIRPGRRGARRRGSEPSPSAQEREREREMRQRQAGASSIALCAGCNDPCHVDPSQRHAKISSLTEMTRPLSQGTLSVPSEGRPQGGLAPTRSYVCRRPQRDAKTRPLYSATAELSSPYLQTGGEREVKPPGCGDPSPGRRSTALRRAAPRPGWSARARSAQLQLSRSPRLALVPLVQRADRAADHAVEEGLAVVLVRERLGGDVAPRGTRTAAPTLRPRATRAAAPAGTARLTSSLWRSNCSISCAGSSQPSANVPSGPRTSARRGRGSAASGGRSRPGRWRAGASAPRRS